MLPGPQEVDEFSRSFPEIARFPDDIRLLSHRIIGMHQMALNLEMGTSRAELKINASKQKVISRIDHRTPSYLALPGMISSVSKPS